MSRLERTPADMAALWLSLVQGRCLRGIATAARPAMSPAERVKLLDAAMRSGAPEAYLAGMQSAFDEAGREDDATIAASLRLIYRAGKIEVLMSMRAEWLGLRSLTQPPPGPST